MENRQGLSKRLRFEVFKRDSFKCQYCGQSAPDVILNVDHIHPSSKGGTSDITNLITACFGCNSGKSDIPLSERAATVKRKAQLDLLQERREQLGMMAEWQEGLTDLEGEAAETAARAWASMARPFHLNEKGVFGLRKHIQRFGLSAVLEAIRISAATYLEIGADGLATKDSAEFAIGKIGGVCVGKQRERENPELSEIHHIINASNKRFGYRSRWKVLPELQSAFSSGVPVEKMWEEARCSRSWSDFISRLESITETYL